MTEDHQREKYNIEECYSDFLIYCNNRVQSTINVDQYVTVMNVRDKELINKIKKILLTREIERKFW